MGRIKTEMKHTDVYQSTKSIIQIPTVEKRDDISTKANTVNCTNLDSPKGFQDSFTFIHEYGLVQMYVSHLKYM